ncbi:Protein of unknown function [Cotesia congregata]|uniref:Uncharacterized protein n=1 Tax=Cotesia congregata TaxID=51543 RepID=A0A8J2MTY8_COTCN|nr:Protein of unknown function [Cotesia congregata]
MELANNKKLTPTVVKRLEKQLITLKLYYMQENPDDIAKKLDISNRTVYNYYDQRSKIIKEAKLFTTPDPIILALLNDLELLIPPKALNQDQSQQAEKIDSEASSSNVQEPNLIKEGRQIQSSNVSKFETIFSDCILLLTGSDNHKLSNATKNKLIQELQFLISSMTSTEDLFKKLLMTDPWEPFGMMRCYYGSDRTCEKGPDGRKTIACRASYESFQDDFCNRRSSDQLDYNRDGEIIEKYSLCHQSFLSDRPAAECINCIIDFWKRKDSSKVSN